MHESFQIRRIQVQHLKGLFHCHPEIELTFIEDSAGIRFVGDSVKPFRSHDLVLLGSQLPHCWLSSPRTNKRLSSAIVLQFRQDLFGTDFFKSPELEPIKNLLTQADKGLHFSASISAQTHTNLDSLLRNQSVDRVLAFLATLSKLSQDRYASPLASAAYCFQPDPQRLARVQRVQDFVMTRFSRPVHLKDAARIAHLAENAFCRFFKQTFGKTFVQYLNEVRVGHACRLLTESDETSISNAGFESGYNNLSHFNREFLRITGLTPTGYRQQFRRLNP